MNIGIVRWMCTNVINTVTNVLSQKLIYENIHYMMSCRELAEESGIDNWKRVPALNTNTRYTIHPQMKM